MNYEKREKTGMLKVIKDLPINIQYHMSELVEEKSSEKEKEDGWDIADYILNIYRDRNKI